MQRRVFIALFGGSAAVGLLAARVQRGQVYGTGSAIAQSVPLLGYAANRNADQQRLDAFRRGLTELGYLDGQNLRINYREGVLDADYYHLMTEFVVAKVDVILAANVPAAVAAGKATGTIPIVMLSVNDPVGLGLVKSLEHPGTNVTGTTQYAPQLIDERLSILKSIIPNLDKIAMVLNGNNPNNAAQLERARWVARDLGMEVISLDLRKPEDVEPAFAQAASFGAKALINGVDSFINSRRFALAAEAEKYELPAIYTDVEYVEAGGSMSLGPGHLDGFYQAAKYVDKILHGADPAQLAIAGPTQFTLSIRRSKLANLGLRLPPEIIARVNEWID
ncbi:MAG: ABC transporter substrate-binding protein [Xanthobacteraceae bacterium]|nr:ABC transporter substrate-binding protein [Xanthobacteraceae bacterium]